MEQRSDDIDVIGPPLLQTDRRYFFQRVLLGLLQGAIWVCVDFVPYLLYVRQIHGTAVSKLCIGGAEAFASLHRSCRANRGSACKGVTQGIYYIFQDNCF